MSKHHLTVLDRSSVPEARNVNHAAVLTSIPKIAYGSGMPKYTVTIKLMKFIQDNAIVI